VKVEKFEVSREAAELQSVELYYF